MPPMNQHNAITTQPSNHQPNAFNSTRYPSLQPINRNTVHSTNTQQRLDQATCSFNYNTGNPPAPFQHTTPSTDEIINPAPLSRCMNGSYVSPPTEPLKSSSCTSTFPLSTDHPNSLALKEILLRLNDMVDQLFSIIALMPITVHHCTTETSPSAIPPTMQDTSSYSNQKHDSIPTQLNIYELMLALLPTIYDPFDCTHPQELKHTPTTIPPGPHKNSQETTHRSSNLSAKNDHSLYYCTRLYNIGTSDLLWQNLPKSPMYTKDLWKPP